MVQPHCEHSPEWMMDTALHLYARCGRADAAEMQLRHGADTEVCNAQGFTPLLLAVRFNQLEVLQVLLQHGARADALAPLETGLGHGVELGSCVHFAAESGHVQVLKFLVTAAALDADEYTRGRLGITPLHLAARLGRVDVVRFLVARNDVWDTELSTGNEPVDLGRHHETALHEACKAQKLRRLREVLKRQGVWVNARVFSTTCTDECSGWTALHIAASRGWQAGLALLIAHGANVELATGDSDFGWFPIRLRRRRGFKAR
ncbi:hypothetical protein PR001_g16830 [Phytophthora rubi]|uniref:Uncharacterized protein n=1 Tax=Phytophthora rubi TaxID=129364 RepID=A0A6A3KKQ4_9STRA|nr:hypothetical protein PR001_g16830 [Phytophthora rubi]